MVKRRRKSDNKVLWGTVGAVGVVVVAIVLAVILTKSGPQQSYFGPTSPTILAELQDVPASVYNAVGVSSSIQTGPLLNLKGVLVTTKQPALTYKVGGKTLPGIVYVGAEFCPYCAATRWGMITALSRFGHFNTLYNMLSSDDDVYPSTPTFSFVGKKPTNVVTYTSKYFAFQAYEQLDRNSNNFMKVPTAVEVLVGHYDYAPSTNSYGGIPFMDVGNRYFITGGAYDPSTLANLSRSSIAAGLTDPSIPVTQAIISTANYVSAAICSITHAQPGSVCHSSGVVAAATAAGIKL
jgi:hypothetical protein